VNRDLDTLPSWARSEMRRLRGRVRDLEAALPFEGRTQRVFAKHRDYCSGADYCGCPDNPVAGPGQQADLVCSDTGRGHHKPVIDIDMPCRLVESHTPGHFHLYIDHEMGRVEYWTLLEALAKAGIVETGYVLASKRRGYSAVRHPDRLAK
jgi:hypothetical protein